MSGDKARSMVVYEWPDGVQVLFDDENWRNRKRPGPARAFLMSGKGWSRWPMLVLSPETKFSSSTEPVLYLESPKIYEFDEALEKSDLLRKRLLGFVLDLGVRRFHPAWSGLVTTHSRPPTVLLYPRWVSDEVWATRYDVARTRIVPGHVPLTEESLSMYRGPLIGGIEDFFVLHYRDKEEWYAKWNSGRTNRTTDGTMSVHSPDMGRGTMEGSLEDVVDWCLDYELVLPESRREVWEKKNVLRGTFVVPSQDEVEVFRMLGEMLPFFWGYDRLGEWLEARKG